MTVKIDGAQVLAALNLYSRALRSFTAVERDRARGFADRVAGGVAIALKMARRAELTDDLLAALAGRAIIDQALGIVMGQRRCSADEAFGVLREVSQTGNIKLRDVPARLITVTTGQPPRPEPSLQQGPETEQLRQPPADTPGPVRRARLARPDPSLDGGDVTRLRRVRIGGLRGARRPVKR